MKLRAGPVTLEFNEQDASLRYLRAGGAEAVRGVVAAVRDRDWNTIPAEVRDLDVQQGSDSFVLTFSCRHLIGDAGFEWQGRVTGTAQGVVTFGFDGTADAAFERNRIGFCVLHPMECAGLDCRVEHVDGRITESRFPGAIEPHQPFLGVRAISHSPAAGVNVEVRMEGDTFEMEDQRNWTDASFKTYCTPLGEPFPVRLEAGDRVQQRIIISSSVPEHLRVPAETAPAGRTLELGAEPRALLPLLGSCLPDNPAAGKADADQSALLRSLGLAHLRVDLQLGSGDRHERLRQAVAGASELGAPLELALHLTAGSEREQLEWLRDECSELEADVARWLVFHRSEPSTTQQWLRLAAEVLRPVGSAPFLAGTDHFFTELNRGRPPAGAADGVAYSINPQVHAFDDTSLFETLAVQGLTASNARVLAAGGQVSVSPITLKMRSNPNATGPGAEPDPLALPPQVDPRQRELLTAAWTLGSISHLALAGADSVTYYRTTGWLGLLELAEGCALPERFGSAAGEVFPVYHLLADVLEVGQRAVLLQGTGPGSLVLRAPWGRRTIVANMGSDAESVTVLGLQGEVRHRILGAGTLTASRSGPLAFRADWTPVALQDGAAGFRLEPFSLVTIDERFG